jgi:unsaturated rhamnogalacturonyl hydrolase
MKASSSAANGGIANPDLAARLDGYGPQTARFVAHYIAQWQPYRHYWCYEDGCVFKGALDLADATGQGFLAQFVRREVSARVDVEGHLRGYAATEFNIDHINAGKVLFPIWRETGEARYRQAIESLAEQLRQHPRTRSGGYWHKRIYPEQIWLDGLYMALPFQCAYAEVVGDEALTDDVKRQFQHVRATLRDARTGLYYHGWDESRRERWANPTTGCSSQFWGRAMGWFVMALIDCIEWLRGAPAFSAAPLEDMLREVCEGLVAVRSQSGLWYQVLDQGTREGNYEETSCSLMIAYAMLKGARLRVLESTYAAVGDAALARVIERRLTTDRLTGICGVAGLGNVPYRDGSYTYYLSEPQIDNDPKGVAALLMALAEGCRFRQDARATS